MLYMASFVRRREEKIVKLIDSAERENVVGTKINTVLFTFATFYMFNDARCIFVRLTKPMG